MANDPTIPLPSQKTVHSIWLDVNTLIGVSPLPDLVPDVQAINNSLYNLFRCPVGARGPIFQPEYGSGLMQLLHEPLDYITANKIKMYLFQAIQRWEPRVNIDMGNSFVKVNSNINAFYAQMAYTIVATKQAGLGTFTLGKL